LKYKKVGLFMAKDRLIFLVSFAILGLIGAFLFRHNDTPSIPDMKTVTLDESGDKKTLVLMAPVKEKKANLSPEAGKIAVPYQLNLRSAIVQFMNPGNFVDITFTSKDEIGFGRVSLTLFKDIRILGIGKDPEGNRVNYYKSNTPTEILLEMTPRQAEIFSYAQLAGDVSLGIMETAQNEQYNDLAAKLLESNSDANFNSVLVTHMVRSLFPKINIDITATGKGYIITGKVPNQKTIENIMKVLNLMASGGDKSIVNLTEEQADTVEVLIAQQDLNPKEPITLEDYKWVHVSPSQITPSLIIRSTESEKWLNESIISNYVAKGEKIQRSDIAWSKEAKMKIEEKLGISLDPGKSVVPFMITTRAPVAQFLNPGALVGVKFASNSDIGFGTVSLNLLNDIRVVSIGKDKEGKNFNKNRCMYNECSPLEVFLEMTPHQAELLGYAQTAGSLTLELADNSQPYPPHRLVEKLTEADSAPDFQSILVTDMIRTLFPNVDIRLTAAPKGYILEGRVPDPQVAAKIIEILARLVPEGEKAIVNLMEVKPQQVLLCVKVVEVVRDYVQHLGLNWELIFKNAGAIATAGAVYPTTPLPNPNFFVSAQNVQFGKVTLNGLLDLLEEDGRGKILAEPNLTTISGQKAHFFVGGEFPILIPQGGGGLIGSITVEFKKYGITLDFTPVVDLNGLITMRVAPEVSNLDKENSVVLFGFVIPSLLTRNADTMVKLWPGQSYIIAGLLNDEAQRKDDTLFGLSSIPLIGGLFNSRNIRERKTELLIIVTPYLMSEDRPCESQPTNEPGRCDFVEGEIVDSMNHCRNQYSDRCENCECN
jgi:Flp pilus assembly protein CpaB